MSPYEFLKGKVLTKKNLEIAARLSVLWVEKHLVGKTGQEKKEYATRQLILAVEKYDQLIPVVGDYLDLPFVDGLEDWALSMVVERAWGFMQSLKLKFGTEPQESDLIPEDSIEEMK